MGNSTFEEQTKAIRDAMFHYNSEVKRGQEWAVPILRGLSDALVTLQAVQQDMDTLNKVFPSFGMVLGGMVNGNNKRH